MASPYSINFMGDLEQWIMQDCSFKPLVGGDTLMISFYYGSTGRKIKRILGYS